MVRRENISEKQFLQSKLIDDIKTRRTQSLATDLQSFLKKLFWKSSWKSLYLNTNNWNFWKNPDGFLRINAMKDIWNISMERQR